MDYRIQINSNNYMSRTNVLETAERYGEVQLSWFNGTKTFAWLQFRDSSSAKRFVRKMVGNRHQWRVEWQDRERRLNGVKQRSVEQHHKHGDKCGKFNSMHAGETPGPRILTCTTNVEIPYIAMDEANDDDFMDMADTPPPSPPYSAITTTAPVVLPSTSSQPPSVEAALHKPIATAATVTTATGTSLCSTMDGSLLRQSTKHIQPTQLQIVKQQETSSQPARDDRRFITVTDSPLPQAKKYVFPSGRSLYEDQLNCLNEKQMLSGSVISFYIEAVDTLFKQTTSSSRNIRALDTDFWELIAQRRTNMVERFFRPIRDNNEAPELVIPVLSNVHWTLGTGRIRHYDSLGGMANTNGRRLTAIMVETLSKFYITRTWKVEHIYVPQQMNGWDCGVYVCKFIDVVYDRYDVNELFNSLRSTSILHRDAIARGIKGWNKGGYVI